VTLVNARRQAGATCGMEAVAATNEVTRDDALTLNARNHSEFMAGTGLVTTGRDGSPLTEWGLRCFSGAAIVANIAMGQTTAAALVDGLMLDEGTCKNVFADATHIGVGYYSTVAPDPGTGAADAGPAGSDGEPSGQRFWTVVLAR
jgi:uncharacterized protein YkwD